MFGKKTDNKEELLTTQMALDKYKKRCHELEDSIEKGYGVKVRNEVTEVKVDFTKMEVAIISEAVRNDSGRDMSIDNMEFYLNLRKKIAQLLEDMKE